MTSTVGGNPQAGSKSSASGALAGGPGAGPVGPLKPAKPIKPVRPNLGGKGPQPKPQVVAGALYYVSRHSDTDEREALFRMDQHSVVELFVAEELGGRIYDFTVEAGGASAIVRGDVVRDGEVSLVHVDLANRSSQVLETGGVEAGDVLDYRVTQDWRRVFYACSGRTGLTRGVIELERRTNGTVELKETR
jgi:hypothetical protein